MSKTSVYYLVNATIFYKSNNKCEMKNCKLQIYYGNSYEYEHKYGYECELTIIFFIKTLLSDYK